MCASLPSWHQGMKIEDDISGEELFSRANNHWKQALKRRGLWVSPKNYDSLTEKERQEAIKRRRR